MKFPKSEKIIAALFVRSDSYYQDFSFVDCYDIIRGAENFNSDLPVIAHPPCRSWSRLRKFAKPRDGEKELALNALNLVRKNGGVLEHPSGSLLWKEKNLPAPGSRDENGICISVPQNWFGHKARKNTFLYICGLDYCEVPAFPYHLGEAEKTVSGHLSKRQRELTPYPFAEFLVTITLRIHKLKQKETAA